MTTPPKLADAQRARGRAKATAVRSARRAFKDKIARGEISLAGAIAAARADEALAGIRVLDLLTSFSRVGSTRAEALMASARIASSRRIRGLGPHQVGALVREWES